MAQATWLRRAQDTLTQTGLSAVFHLLDLRLRTDAGFRRLIRGGRDGDARGWHSRILLESRDGTVRLPVEFRGDRVRVGRAFDERPHATLLFRDAAAARALLTETPAKAIEMLLTGEMVLQGNLSDVARLSFVLNALRERSPLPPRGDEAPPTRAVDLGRTRRSLPMKPCAEARWLKDPGLSRYTLDDFPRLGAFKRAFFETTPEICVERPRLYTEATRRVGFDRDPEYRQGEVLHHLLANKAPIVRRWDLLAGTTTTKPIGVVIYPECGGLVIWPELETVARRPLNPYRITKEAIAILNDEVYPYWMDRNVREHARAAFDDPLALRLDERFALYFQWKNHAISHTIPDFPKVLERGLSAIAAEARARAEQTDDARAATFYRAVARSLDGVIVYANALAAEAERLATNEPDGQRKAELAEIARICRKVPEGPAETLHEALQSTWITWIACHMENTNAGLSVGRIDQWLQPYFAREMAALAGPDAEAAREAYVARAIELVGCFFLRLTDHLPQVADLGNKLFGGSSSDQVITLGGVTPDGGDGVNDVTYVCLKVAEMLGLRDPNLNARYAAGVNSRAYLERLCEVNYLTGATPSIHGDESVVRALLDQGMTIEHARDWSATGCVEPTSCGRHYGHTGCLMFNLVAPLEMALRDGYHPLLGDRIGPRTGDPSTFASYEQFEQAYFAQLRWLIERAAEGNNLLGETHRIVRPTPLLSGLVEGPLEKGRDLIDGGALYNSTGVGNVGLCDVIDSLAAVKAIVFDEQRATLPQLIAALDVDFAGHEALHARLTKKAPKFGTGDPAALAVAQRVVKFVHETFRAQPHYRGGHYNAGFWSMSNHVAFGILSGALPSGRRKGKAFTPGLTPTGNGKGASMLQQIHDVAGLDPLHMPNNIAFNVKVAPAPGDGQARAVGTMTALAETYLQEGGMQLQFNVVDSATLRDAREHPERYPTLMVRISGYNAYFNDLNDDMKLELIERTEHALGTA